MTDTIKKKTVSMTAEDWLAASKEARALAVVWLKDDSIVIRSAALKNAAEMLRAADAFAGRFNVLAYVEEGVDEAEIEVFPAEDPSHAD